MTVTFDLPDEIANALAVHGDLSRRALEGLAVEEFRAGHLSQAPLRKLLGFSTRHQLDGFLKARGEFVDYSIREFNHDWEVLRNAGF